MKNKKLIIMLSVITILVLTLGVSFAIFTYNNESVKNSSLVVGDIYMHYNETNQIKMDNAVPTNPYIVNPIMATQEYTKGGTNELSKCADAFVDAFISSERATTLCKDTNTLQQVYDLGELDQMNLTDTFVQENILTINSSRPYFEFTVDGKNTTTDKDIWYEVVLSKGDDITGKTRIKDNLLKFSLTETKDNKETIVFNDRSYNDLTNKRIWVNTINKNTTSEVNITYRLYMWISNDTVIGNVDQDYTIEEWKNIFASIKVGVSGDFNEKYIIPETSCFTTKENETGLTIIDYNKNCEKKIIIPQTINNKNVTKIGEGAFRYKNLMNIVIPDSVTTIGEVSFANNQLTNVEIPSSVTTIGRYAFAYNQLTNVEIPSSVTTIESGTFDNNKISNVNINTSITSIGAYAFTNNNIRDLIVPDTVKKLHCKSFDDGVVNNRDMTCTETATSCFYTYDNEDGTLHISEYDNTCDKDVIIPEKINDKNISIISFDAFKEKDLTSVVLPKGLKEIYTNAFYSNKIVAVSIPDSVTFLSCEAFDSNVIITKSNNLVCVKQDY